MRCPECGRAMILEDATYWEEQEYYCSFCNIAGTETPRGQKFFKDGKEIKK